MTNQPQKHWKILLLGDSCIDEYHYGVVERISPEAPVPIFKHIKTEQKLGMADNVARNLHAFGCNLTTVFGSGVPIKQRFIDMKHKHMLLRVDYDDVMGKPIKDFPIANYDAVVVSDYNKGSINREILHTLGKTFDVPIFVDTKKCDLDHYDAYKNMFFKLNEPEFKSLKFKPTNLIVTMGENGAHYCGKMYPTVPVEVTDVCGAGDTFLAALVYQYLETKDIGQAINFANRAASVTVQHTGVYAPTLEEINATH